MSSLFDIPFTGLCFSKWVPFYCRGYWSRLNSCWHSAGNSSIHLHLPKHKPLYLQSCEKRLLPLLIQDSVAAIDTPEFIGLVRNAADEFNEN